MSDQYLSVSVNGDLINRGEISSHGLTLSANTLENRDTGVISSTANSNITIKKSLKNSGNLVANNESSLSSNELENSRLISSKKLKINCNQLHNKKGSIFAEEITGNIQDILKNTEGNISAAETLDLTSNTLQNIRGTVKSTGAKGKTSFNVYHLVNQGGDLVANTSEMDINATVVDNQGGKISHIGEGQLNLHNIESFNNNEKGVLQTNGSLVSDDTTTINNSQCGKITAKTMNLSGKINNNHGFIQAENLQAKLKGSFDNSGGQLLVMGETGSTSLHADKIINENGGKIGVNTPEFTFSSQEINNQSGKISHEGKGELNLYTNSLANNNNSEFKSNGHLIDNNKKTIIHNNTNGLLKGNKITLSGIIHNEGGVIEAGTLNAILSGPLYNNTGCISLFDGYNQIISAPEIHNSHSNAIHNLIQNIG